MQALEENKRAARRQNEVILWENRLKHADNVAEDYYKEYDRNLEFFVGKQLDDIDLDRGGVPFTSGNTLIVNRILASIASQQANIMPRVPWFRLASRRPLGQQGEESREAAEHILNYVMQHPRNSFKLHARLAYLGMSLGFGALKVTYTPDEGIDPEKGREEELGEMVVVNDPETGEDFVEIIGGIPKRNPDGSLMRRGKNKFVVDNRNPADYYRMDFVDWRSQAIDPDGKNDIHDHAWWAHRMDWTYKQIMDNPIFTDKRGIEDAAFLVESSGLTSQLRRRIERRRRLEEGGGGEMFYPTPAERDIMRFYGWQIWDAETREIIYLVDGYHNVMGKTKYPKWVETFPVSVFKQHEVIDEFFPLPPVTACRPLARSYNLSRSMKINHVRRFNRKYLMRAGMLAPEEEAKLRDTQDGDVLVYKSGNPQDLQPLIDAPLDPQIYADMERDITDFNEIMGSSSERRAVAESGTATQAAIIERGSASRDDDIRQTGADGLSRAAGIMLNALQATLDTEMAVAIRGPQGGVWESRLSRIQIQGDYDVKVDLTELEPHDIRSEKSDMIAMLQVIGPETFFQSPTATKRFFQAFRWNDPDVVEEFMQIATNQQEERNMLLQAQLEQQAQQSSSTSSSRGGFKAVAQGPEGGRLAEGRESGRELRAG